MSLSAFSFDALDELLATPLDSVGTNTSTLRGSSSNAQNNNNNTHQIGLSTIPSSTLSSGTNSSGESPSFVMLGSSLAGGGSVKRSSLVINPSATSLCLGCIGTSKFYLRLLGEGNGCGISAHSTKKFSPPQSSGFLKESEIHAFCSPVYDLHPLSASHLLRLSGVQLSAGEWDDLFSQVRLHSFPKWLDVELSPSAAPSDLRIETDSQPTSTDLMSSLAHTMSGGLFALIPSLSFEDSVSSEASPSSLTEMDLQDVTSYIVKFKHHFASLKTKWTRAFTEIESGYGLLVKDLQHLHQMSTTCLHDIGQHIALAGPTPTSVWNGLATLQHQVTSVSSSVIYKSPS